MFSGDDQSAEHPVPQSKGGAHISVPVLGRVAMVNLMLRRTDHYVLKEVTPGNPDVAVPQVRTSEIEDFSCRRRIDHVEQGEVIANEIQKYTGDQSSSQDSATVEDE